MAIWQCPFNFSPCLGTGLRWEKNSDDIIYTGYSSHAPPPQCPTSPPTPRVGEGGEGGWGTWGWGVEWGIGGVGYEKNILYISIHTHMLVPRLRWGKKSEIPRFHLRFNRFGKFYRQIECQVGVQLIKYIPDRFIQFLFPQITVIQ